MNEEKIIAPRPRPMGRQRPLTAEEKEHNRRLRLAHGYAGRYAAVRGRKVVGYFSKYDEALKAAGDPNGVCAWNDRLLGYFDEEGKECSGNACQL